MSGSVLGIGFMAWMGGGEELVWTDQGVGGKPGSDGDDDPPLALWISGVGRFGKAAPSPPDSIVPVPLPLLMWCATGESIWAVFGFTEVGEGGAPWASGSPGGQRGSAGPKPGRAKALLCGR